MDQAGLLAARFPGSRTRPNTYGGVTLIYELDGVWHDARIIDGVNLEAFVRTMDAPHFHMTIEGREFGASLPQRYDGPTPADVDEASRTLEATRSSEALRIRKADDPIADLWIDPPGEQAVVGAMFAARDDSGLVPRVVLESFRYVIEGGAVWFNRRAQEPEHLYRAFVAASTLAARPHRIARASLDLAHGLGGTTTADRWDLADHKGEFAVMIDRGAAAVRIDNVRRLPGDPAEHLGLYTRARARRVAAEGDRWALWRPSIARHHRPKPGRGLRPVAIEGWDALATDPARLGARLKATAALLDAAQPYALATIDDAIELWWPGLVQDPARIGPAVELLARLAIEMDASVGPYR